MSPTTPGSRALPDKDESGSAVPTVFRAGGYRFFFYSNEGSPREPPHVHVEAGDAEAKFWLRPEVSVVYNDGFDGKTLRELLRLVEVNRERIEKAWRGLFR